MYLPDEVVEQIVAATSFVDKKKLAESRKSAQELRKPLAEILIFKGLISEEILGQLIADYFKVPFVSLRHRHKNNCRI